MKEPLEIERKFEVHNFSRDLLPANTKEVFVTQDYLIDNGEGLRRVRSVRVNGGILYRFTIKKPTGQRGTRIEIESEITKEDYENYLKEKDPESQTIKKFRYTFPYEGKKIEVDIMVEPEYVKNQVFLEVELNDIDEELELPPEFVVTERTDDERYSNHSIARGLLLD
jgi:CYTH domain-containing protein